MLNMAESVAVDQSSHKPSSSSATPVDVVEKDMRATADVHKERHVGHGELIRDSIIGFSDGLTVPFALCAGLSSLQNQRVVIVGGLAELFAGSISMGLGAYLASSTERKHYLAEEARERREVSESPQAEEDEIFEIFEQYGIQREECKGVVEGLKANKDMWVQFMMDFELRLEKPDTKKAWLEGLVMGAAYFFGGLLPMVPYFAFQHNVNRALYVSIAITATILVIFGFVKARIIGISNKGALSSAAQTLLIGAAAAASAYGIVKAVNTSKAL